MTYLQEIIPGRFLIRPNRFIAHVEIQGQIHICHVKNTGRCRELLTPGATVYCADCLSGSRKTRYDLIAVEKGTRLINMDSQAPNAAVAQWLRQGGLGQISELKPETTFGNSRFDFSFIKDGKLCFMEVKGVTLENDGVCSFPDAPTTRGTRHVQELTRLKSLGYGAYILFVIQMSDVKYLTPNEETDPAFCRALREANDANVQLLAMDCQVQPGSMHIGQSVPVRL